MSPSPPSLPFFLHHNTSTLPVLHDTLLLFFLALFNRVVVAGVAVVVVVGGGRHTKRWCGLVLSPRL